MLTRQIRVTGRVQGVGFRYALRAEALRLGIAGWVRNRADGSVEALLQSDEEKVERLIEWSRRGPPGARVDEVQSVPAEEPHRVHAAFEQRPSL